MTRGRAGIALVAASVVLVGGTAFLGESVAARGLRPQGLLPPYALDTHPSPWLVVALLAVATVAGATGLLLANDALSRGWHPDARKLLAGGCVAAFALLLVPPVTSEDVYSYAAYGRIAATGHDPYTTAPSDLGGDPVTRGASKAWRDSPSVYGPVATAEQYAVMKAGGPRPRTGAALLALASALAFAGTGLLLYRAARDDSGRRRVALLWAVNPLLLTHLVAAAHVDSLLVLLAVAAVIALRRNAFLAGLLAGGAVCVKVSGVLVAAALGWTKRRDPARLAAGAALVAVPAYVLAGGWTALRQVRTASGYVTSTSPWHVVAVGLDHVDAPRAVLTALTLAVVAALVPLFARTLPGDDSAHRTTAAITLAWLVGAAYVTPWYDAWLWPFLALLPASRWDRWLAARTAVLTLAILPGRAPLPPGLAGGVHAMRAYVAPVALALLAVEGIRRAVRQPKIIVLP